MARQYAPIRPNGQRYEELFQHIGFGVLVADSDGVVRVANPAAIALLQIPESDLVGKSFEIGAISLDGSRLDRDDYPIMQAIARRAAVRDVAIGILRRGNRNRSWLLADAEPVFTAGGEVSEVVLSLADVTGIREEGERFRQLIESLNQTAILMNADATQALYVSPKYKELWGRPVEEMYANPRSWMDFVFPGDRPRVEAAMERLMKGEPIIVEHRVVLPDGSIRWMLHSVFPMRDPEGHIIRLLGSSSDITERKVAEEALREAEERLLAVLQQVPAIVWTTDTESRFTSVMGTGLQRVGLSENELNGVPVSQLFEPEGPDFPAIEAHRRALAGESVAYEAEWRGRIYESQVQPLHDRYGKTSGAVGVALDVTEREQAKKLAIEWKTRYDAAVQASGHVLFDADVRTDAVKFAGNAEKVLGYSIQELEGDVAHWIELIHPEDRAKFETEIQRSRRAREPCQLEYRLRSKRGGYIDLQCYGQPVFDAAGNLHHMVGFISNITERKRLEEQLRQAQKMEAVGRLAGGVAHDFNNLLQIILGYSEVLREQMAGEDQALSSLAEIDSAARRSEALVSQLLAFSRRQVLKPSVVDLNEIVRSAERMLRPLLGEDIELRTNLASDLGRVAADAGQISQVIVNLAVNGRDAMPGGGALTITTANVDFEQPEVRPDGTVPAGKYVLLSVSDSGIGIDPETRSRIFEPFFTTKGTGQGTGLGLSMVQGIVAQSGGYILIDSEPGRGTTFHTYLPRMEAHPVTREEAAPVETSPGKETILLVEDEDAVRKLVKLMLEKAGYTVFQARSGAEALSICEAYQNKIDLLITDIVMPGMSGPALAEKARKKCSGVKVLYISGYTDEGARGAAIPRGSEFLAKPFSAGKVLYTVRRVLDQAA